MAITQTEDEWIATVESWPRAELLHMCRMHGISAHRTKSNHDLAYILWNLIVDKPDTIPGSAAVRRAL